MNKITEYTVGRNNNIKVKVNLEGDSIRVRTIHGELGFRLDSFKTIVAAVLESDHTFLDDVKYGTDIEQRLKALEDRLSINSIQNSEPNIKPSTCIKDE